MGGHGTTGAGISYSLSCLLSALHAEKKAIFCCLGCSALHREFSPHPTPAVTLPHSRVSTLWATSSSHSPGSAQSIQPTRSKTLEAENTSLIEQPLATSESQLAGLSRELLQLQQRVTTALRELLIVRASVDYFHRELDLKVELVTFQNDTQLAKAEAQLAEAKAQHADTATALQQAHLNSIAALD